MGLWANPRVTASLIIFSPGAAAVMSVRSQDWALHVRHARARDAGLYECQVSTHPPSSLFVELQLVGELFTLRKTIDVACWNGNPVYGTGNSFSLNLY
jgi:hypothetical protein